MEAAINSPRYHEVIERSDMLSENKDLRILQITTDNRFAYSHIYPEARVFSPDSRRFVFNRLMNLPETAITTRLIPV